MANTRWAGAWVAVIAMHATAWAESAAPATPATPPPIDAAIRTATLANKPLLVEFSATWCGPCQVFEKTVLPDPDVQRALGAVVFVHYDVEVSPGLDAATRFDVDAYPTFIVIDRRGVDVKRHRGGFDAHGFIELLRSAPHDAEDEAELRADLAAYPTSPSVRLRAARWFDAHHRPREAREHYTAVANDESAQWADRAEAATAADHLRRADAWRRGLVADKVALVRAAPSSVALDDLAIALVDSELAPREIRALVSAALAASLDVGRTRAIIDLALAAGATGEALAAADHLADDSPTLESLDTLAECLHAAGDGDQAVLVSYTAVSLAAGFPTVEERLKQHRARFESGTGDSDAVAQLHLRVADLSTRLAAADRLAPHVESAVTMQARIVAWKRAYEASRAFEKMAAAVCARDAGTSEMAVARIVLDGAGHVKSSVVLVEPTAPAALRTCLTRQISTATFPVLPGVAKQRLDFAFKRP